MVKLSGDENEYTTTVDDLLLVVTLDLHLAYQRRGDVIMRQKHGCPIGGFLSPIYANVKCARDEFIFMNEVGKARCKICGIRQVDDLILMIAYRDHDRKSYEIAKKYA